MKNKLKHIFFASALMAAATNFTACSLDEVNPGEFTMDSLAETEETYEKNHKITVTSLWNVISMELVELAE